MKLAQINFTKGLYIPGLGQVMKLENVEAENVQGGLAVMTSAAKVMIPWDRIDVVVTEWITLKLQGLNGIVEAAGKAQQAAPAVCVELTPQRSEYWGPGLVLVDQLGATPNAQAAMGLTLQERAANDRALAAGQQQSPKAAAALQPGPPSKKGGRRG